MLGAAIALLGQHLTKRSEARARTTEMLLNACAHVVASSSDLLNRIWEEHALRLEGRVVEWDLAGHRLASARVEILSVDVRLVAALHEVNEAGKALGAYWRRGNTEEAEYQARRDRYRAAMHAFTDESGRAIRNRTVRS
ncbi:hypothetical protein [Streptomyces sp. NPDC008141]|uniref:hypothetical protein n=1 Tax=Streptomyces sp. NPDC008141 TaxID=3364815 RepID=UPI0036E00654